MTTGTTGTTGTVTHRETKRNNEHLVCGLDRYNLLPLSIDKLQ